MTLLLNKPHNTEKCIEYLQNLDDGQYFITIIPINADIRSKQKQYFALVDEVVAYSGYKRQEIHEMHKADKNIESTKNFELIDWLKFIDEFKFWVFNKWEIMI